MAKQQALDVVAADIASSDPVADVDIAETVLQAHGGDALMAIRELLADAEFLRDQLYTASCIMSQGMARGWKPRYERIV